MEEDSCVLITGKAAVGKSTLLGEYVKKGYMVISMDEVIRNHVIPKIDEFKQEPWVAFGLYKDDHTNPTINKARDLFIQEMQHAIKGKKNIAIEGSLTDINTIQMIFRNRKFMFYYVKPKDEETYIKRIKQRFCENPEHYGRMGFLKSNDLDCSALKDYNKHGLNGKIITEFIERVGKLQFQKINDTYEHYKKQFDVNVYTN